MIVAEKCGAWGIYADSWEGKGTCHEMIERDDQAPGRPRKYCDDVCRQRAYRARKNVPCRAEWQVHVPGADHLFTVICNRKVHSDPDHQGVMLVEWSSPVTLDAVS